MGDDTVTAEAAGRGRACGVDALRGEVRQGDGAVVQIEGRVGDLGDLRHSLLAHTPHDPPHTPRHGHRHGRQAADGARGKHTF